MLFFYLLILTEKTSRSTEFRSEDFTSASEPGTHMTSTSTADERSNAELSSRLQASNLSAPVAELNDQNDLQQRSCWVCFATPAEDDGDAEWIRPCRCRGSTMWVHQKCLQRWVDEKQKGNMLASVACSSCGSRYLIIYPPLNFAVRLLQSVDLLVNQICPLVTGGIIIISLYWTAITYGAITVMQILGYENAMDTMERADPLLLIVGLPAVPILLITIKMVRWEDKVVSFLYRRMTGSNQQLAANFGAGAAAQPVDRDPASATRMLCGALALPTFAVIVGRIMFGDTISPLKRTIYGAALFMAARGATKIYYKYQQIVSRQRRRILNYRSDIGDVDRSDSDRLSPADMDIQLQP